MQNQLNKKGSWMIAVLLKNNHPTSKSNRFHTKGIAYNILAALQEFLSDLLLLSLRTIHVFTQHVPP